MTDALVVDLNRSSHHAIEPASESFETDGPFVVRVQNHGEGSHIHCSLSGDLATTATITEGNPFLEPEEVVEIPVDVRTDLRPARGSLELSTGYGRESVSIEVLVRTSDSVPTSPIESDRDGSTAADANAPQSAAESRGSAGEGAEAGSSRVSFEIDRTTASIRSALPRRDVGTALLGALALLAVAIAVVAWQVIDGLVVYLAVLLVVATVLGAVVALVRE